MKLLFDENLPRRLARHFPAEFEVSTTQRMGWTGKSNGELLHLAASHAFDAFITTDRNIEYQQNLATLPIPIIVMVAEGTDAPALTPLVPVVVKVLAESLETRVYRVTA